ncbi:MAG: TrkA family potassium uptake protein [Clostridia bacterium]|nr:TrkA family potassium uptake protein [Clostridia bacterium]
MSINKQYAVFGLGRYGSAIAKELVKSGADVLAVDRSESAVNAVISEIPFSKCADVTDKAVIDELGIANTDVVIIAMASCLEASVMATMLAKEAGVKTVIVKVSDEMQGKILKKVGADKVVIPEYESGTRLAKNLLSSDFVDMVELSRDVSLVEIPVKEDWAGKSLQELGLRNKYSINVVAEIKNEEVDINIDPFKLLDASSSLVVIAKTENLNKLK